MSSPFSRMKREGFTLIELLLVIGIIAVLASIVIIAINPTRQLSQARDAQRRSDVNTILNAIYQYSIDNNGNLPDALASSVSRDRTLKLCKNGYVRGVTTGNCVVNTSAAWQLGSGNFLSLQSLTGSYLVGVPSDPSRSSGTGYTYYTVIRDSTGRITVTATPETPGGQAISVTR